MIFIPTAEFVGLLSDVVWCPIDVTELPTHSCVRIAWDGERLHAAGRDGIRVAWSMWDPTDPAPPGEEQQDELGVQWGGTDNRWVIWVWASDAKDLIKIFKLGRKEGRSPLRVTVDRGRISVVRSRETGHAELTADVPGVDVAPAWDPAVLLGERSVGGRRADLTFDVQALSGFCSVRPRGLLKLTVTSGTTVLVQIGPRFHGSLLRQEDKPR